MSYLPSSAWKLPPSIPCDDPVDRKEEELFNIIPVNTKQTYDMRIIIELILDKNSFFEIASNYAQSAIVGFGRLNGHVIGILGSDCRYG